MLDNDIKTQLQTYLQMIINPVIIEACLDDSNDSNQISSFLKEVSDMSDKVSYQEATSSIYKPSFFIKNQTSNIHINMAMLPTGHEFTTFVLALLQVGGHPLKISEKTISDIKNIKEELSFTTYISLSCPNCPDVVQAINIMALLNPNIKSTTVDGSLFEEEVEEQNITAVPTIKLNGQDFSQGRISLEDILNKLDAVDTQAQAKELNEKGIFDVLVIGAGPSGATAAIYAARKGIKTGIIADRLGGQLLETIDIENFISIKKTQGQKFAQAIEEHIKEYDVDIMLPFLATSITKQNNIFEITLNNNATIKAKSVITSTGARWRKLGVEGDDKKGVVYCPHCDGPLYKGKEVAVIGGGNSGVEAAIDLAGIVKKVTLVEFMDSLKADDILQKKLKSLPNIEIITSAQVSKVIGGDKASGFEYINRTTQEIKTIEVNAIFVQIGLMPNTEWLKDFVELNKAKEIIIDSKCQTSVAGFFAAGDASSVPYKQIIIAAGEGAKASLSAFDYLIRQ